MLNKNSLVRFRNRTQSSPGPMRVQAVRVKNGRRELKVEYRWWPESSFIPDKEWREHRQYVTQKLIDYANSLGW